MPTRIFGRLLVAVIIFSCSLVTGSAQDDVGLSPEQLATLERFASIQWQSGPAVGKIGTMAEIKIPKGYKFTGSQGAQDSLELYGNPRDLGMLGAMYVSELLVWVRPSAVAIVSSWVHSVHASPRGGLPINLGVNYSNGPTR